VTTKCNQIPLGNQPHNCGVEHQTLCCNQSQKTAQVVSKTLNFYSKSCNWLYWRSFKFTSKQNL